MKKYNKINLKAILIGVMVPILVFLSSFNIVYAYFSAITTDKQANTSTGAVIISFTEDTEHVVKSGVQVTTAEYVEPGQSISVSGGVLNKSESSVYSILEVKISLQDSEDYLSSGYYTATGLPLSFANGESTTPATVIEAGGSTSFEIDYDLDFIDYDNSFMGKKLIVTYQARAIQYKNITDGIQACNLLITDVKTLPTKYQQLDYIQSTGTQYIDTGINLTEYDTVLTTFDFPTLQAGTKYISGTRNSGGSAMCGVRVDSSNKISMFYGNAVASDVTVAANTKYTVKTYAVSGSQQLYINGELKVTGSLTASRNGNYTEYLFALNNYNSPQYPTSIRLYSAQYSKDGVLVRNFVPCYRKSDGVAGMYDLVNDVFYTNAGSGEFVIPS